MVQDTSIIKTLLSAVYLFPESISNTNCIATDKGHNSENVTHIIYSAQAVNIFFCLWNRVEKTSHLNASLIFKFQCNRLKGRYQEQMDSNLPGGTLCYSLNRVPKQETEYRRHLKNSYKRSYKIPTYTLKIHQLLMYQIIPRQAMHLRHCAAVL